METGYRRRILIEPSEESVSAELEDDYHRMSVTLKHADGVIVEVISVMKRWPWTTCPGAVDVLEKTFVGVALINVGGHGAKKQNCTHLHDLAVFAAAHADGHAPVAYDVNVSDPVEGVRIARLARDGVRLLDWTLMDDKFLTPASLAGRRINELNEVIVSLDPRTAEAVRILRWASILALGRGMEIPAGLSATAFPPGSCYTFQLERAVGSTRRPDADVDFSNPGLAPMADRTNMF